MSVLTFSEKRKDLLFLLLCGPKTLTEIKNHFNVKSPEILPRIKEMESSNLIYRKEGNTYYITQIGKVVAKYFGPLIDVLDTIEKNEEFWKEHILDDIPQHLLERICELEDCGLLEEGLETIYQSNKDFIENLIKSNVVMGISPIFIPEHPALFVELAQSNIPISLILTKNVFEKLKNEYRDELQIYMDSDRTNLYVVDDVKIAFTVTDCFLSLSLFFKNGIYDPQHDLMGFDESTLKWGRDLFNYHLEQAKEIKTL